ncbi:MAG: nickel insertion protein, partial [Acidimicrobiales bacterium]
ATMASGWGPIPAGVLVASARGAGGRDPQDYPNVVTGYLIEPAVSADQTGGIDQQRSVVISTNLDDVSPEIVGHTIARCLAAGADDAWATPVVMKKGRPGVELHVLSPPDRSEGLRQLVMAETGTLGLRTSTVTKHVSPRRFETVTVRGRPIEVKIGPHGFKPEYEDVAAAAEALELPVRQVSAEAVAAFLAARSARGFANDPGPGQTR